MGNLKEEEVRHIVNRATMFQKFYGSSVQQPSKKFEREYAHLFEITDSLKLDRGFVTEALLEYHGVPVEEPITLDAGFNKAEVLGFSSGELTPDTLRELRGQIEYHFNTIGEIKHRKNKTRWKVKPTGLSRFIASQNSSEVIMESSGAGLKITASQSMKTANKFYLPALAGIFTSVMMFAAAVFEQGGSDNEGFLIGSAFFLGVSVLYTRFINKRKKKRKARLAELVERLQQILERRQKVNMTTEPESTISIPENEYDGFDEIEIKESSKEKTSS